MAQNISNFLENKILDHCLNNVAYSAPGTVYLALFTVAPTETGGGTEVNQAGYARETIPWEPAASNGSLTTDADITFTAGADWGTIVALGIMSAITSGDLLWYGPLVTPRTVEDGDDFEIEAGELTVSLE